MACMKTRPFLIVSPNEMNLNIGTGIVVPMTTKGRNYPTRVLSSFQDKKGQVVLDQIRTIDKLGLARCPMNCQQFQQFKCGR
ncbi:MAG: type II toxin-antitoxin system PemK/MazF family toxin [Proteobacteria bacterium]|nr:type II toxin-antitoxin system PemK/MazF family toxin [Pseudomonadota bacterium]